MYHWVGVREMLSEIVSLISVSVALVAVTVSAWQARANILNARHARSLPVLAESMGQFRAPEFRESVLRLIKAPAQATLDDGFESLPKDLKDDAYNVCYFLTTSASW